MDGKRSTRKIRRDIVDLLATEGCKQRRDGLRTIPTKQAVNVLIGLLYGGEDILKWRAVQALGQVVAGLAEEDTEAARVIMRRLMWSLNDESGGIGWGAPEAMGEIMAVSKRLADEYGHILISYLRPDGNFIEHEPLQRGVLWGVQRLAEVRADQVRGSLACVVDALKAADAGVRGLAARLLGHLKVTSAVPLLEALVTDESRVTLFNGIAVEEQSVGRLARNALMEMEVHEP